MVRLESPKIKYIHKNTCQHTNRVATFSVVQYYNHTYKRSKNKNTITKISSRKNVNARTYFHNHIISRGIEHTLKKFTKAGSSWTSVTMQAVDDDGSKGPSIKAIVGTASSSSNSLQKNTRQLNI